MGTDSVLPVRSLIMEFRDKLLQLMGEKGWSVSDLSKAAGLTFPTVRSYTSKGKAKRLPTLVNAFRLAKALGVSVHVFAECSDMMDAPE